MNEIERMFVAFWGGLGRWGQFVCGLLGIVSCSSVGAAAAEAEQPNVLMICIDDLNDWVGALGGHPDVKTPNIDRLAELGRNFSNAHCVVPVCSASRVSIMSGLHATTHGSYELGPSYHQIPRLKDVSCMQAYFRAHGYHTIAGGKVLHHGFGGDLKDAIDVTLAGVGGPRLKEKMNWPGGAWDWGPYPETDEQMGDYQLAKNAAAALQKKHDQPFFMSVGLFRPHVPMFVPQKWFDLYDRDTITLPKAPLSDMEDIPPHFQRKMWAEPTQAEVLKHGDWRGMVHAYLACVSFADMCVGTILDGLMKGPNRDNTIVVLWSDHGFHLGEKQHWAKRTLWEESTRVPLIIAGPGIQEGQACGDRLEPSCKTVADVLHDHDYETIYLGKWHLAGIKEADGRSCKYEVPYEDRGRFDTWIGYDNNNSQWDTWVHGHEGDKDIPHYRLPGYETDVLTDMALERIAARKDSEKPFFMVVSVQPPHWPQLAPAKNRHYQAQQLTLRPNVPSTLEQRARIHLSGYYAQIENIDENVGRIMDLLFAEDLLNETHVMFFCDHGDQMGSQGRFGKCVPFEESARIPFIIGGGQPMNNDGMRAGNAPCLVNHVDIAPTTLGLCGIATPDWMEGFDYSHRRTGLRFEERVVQEPESAYLQLIGDRETGYAWRAVVTRDGWKYACVENGEWLLFNLNVDPYEMNNLAFHTSYREKRAAMKALLQEWIDKTGDTFVLPA